MGHLYELNGAQTPRIFNRRVPGPVRNLRACVLPGELLALKWRPPAGSRTTFYVVERTHEGRVYETLRTTVDHSCLITDAPWEDPWFYRVRAGNPRGLGEAKRVWFFQRKPGRGSRLLPVPVIPGMKLVIWEPETAGDSAPVASRVTAPGSTIPPRSRPAGCGGAGWA
jgi:hypothetical protein